jgi:hypothetical protein
MKRSIPLLLLLLFPSLSVFLSLCISDSYFVPPSFVASDGYIQGKFRLET